MKSVRLCRKMPRSQPSSCGPFLPRNIGEIPRRLPESFLHQIGGVKLRLEHGTQLLMSDQKQIVTAASNKLPSASADPPAFCSNSVRTLSRRREAERIISVSMRQHFRRAGGFILRSSAVGSAVRKSAFFVPVCRPQGEIVTDTIRDNRDILGIDASALANLLLAKKIVNETLSAEGRTHRGMVGSR